MSSKYSFFKVIVLSLSILVALLSLEIILRIFGPEYYIFNNKSREYYTNPRGYHIPTGRDGQNVLYGLNYKTSIERYRLPDDPSQANINRSNSILGIGDSFTYGRGVKYEDIYLTVLQRSLNRHGYDVTIKNCGVSAHDLPEIYKTYLLESSKKRYPIVIYGFVLNDFKLPVAPFGSDFIDSNNGGNGYSRLRKISKLYNFICYLIEKARLHNITSKAYLEAFRGPAAEIKFGMLAGLNRDIGTKEGKLVIVLFPLLYNFEKYPFREIHKKMSAFCEKEGILLLDLLPAFSKYKAEDLWANPTDHHFNETAHRIVAEELYKFLDENGLLEAIEQ